MDFRFAQSAADSRNSSMAIWKIANGDQHGTVSDDASDLG